MVDSIKHQLFEEFSPLPSLGVAEGSVLAILLSQLVEGPIQLVQLLALVFSSSCNVQMNTASLVMGN